MSTKTTSNPVADFLFEQSRLIAAEIVKSLTYVQLMEILSQYCDFHEDFLFTYGMPTEPKEYVDWFLKVYKDMSKIALITNEAKKYVKDMEKSNKAYEALGSLDGWKGSLLSRGESMSDDDLLQEFKEQMNRAYANIFAKAMYRNQDDSFLGKIKKLFSKKVSIELADVFPPFLKTYYSLKPYEQIRILLDEGIYKFEE